MLHTVTRGYPGLVIEDKLCAVCGRRIPWRRSLARDWEHVQMCSARCRRMGLGPADHALEATIISLLGRLPAGATIDPTEAARLVSGGAGLSLLEPARMAARRLVARGAIEILQNGRVVDPSSARGPIRLRSATRRAASRSR